MLTTVTKYHVQESDRIPTAFEMFTVYADTFFLGEFVFGSHVPIIYGAQFLVNRDQATRAIGAGADTVYS